MKRILCLALALFLCAQGAFAAELTVGVCIYDNTDAFMSSMRLDLESYAQGKAKLIVYDSMNDQNLQNDQVDSLLRENVDALILNPADRMAAGYLIEKAKQRGIPVIFINREPMPEDLLLYEKAYYVGADASQSGRLSGEILSAQGGGT